MKNRLFWGLSIMLLPAMVFAEEKVEAPVWNVGDKWVLTQGIIEIIDADQNGYTMKFPSDKTSAFLLETGGFDQIIFEKPTLIRIYGLKGNKREKYTSYRRTHLNFPFVPGKKWKDIFSAKQVVGFHTDDRVLEYTETYSVLGWEEVEVRAGKFKAIKLECEQVITGPPGYFGQAIQSRHTSWYWYSPALKYFVKSQYNEQLKAFGWKDWELTSFQLKK